VLVYSDHNQYDLVVATIGYEKRSRFVSSTREWEGRRIACSFRDQRVLSFEENKAWFGRHGFSVVDCDDEAWRQLWRKELAELGSGRAETIRVAFDVSSTTRLRMAMAMWEMAAASGKCRIEVDMFYAPARYRRPPKDPGIVEVCGPVIPEFAGWSAQPEIPLALLLGIGYEVEKAIGALEYLEVGDVWVFRPRGVDRRYDAEVDKANVTLSEIVKADRTVDYDVLRPYDGCIRLESLISGLQRNSRIVLVPFGPKIFAAMCLVLSLLRGREVGVWRISGGAMSEPVDHVAAGRLATLRAGFDRA
jgi:hypothetical protein